MLKHHYHIYYYSDIVSQFILTHKSLSCIIV